MFADVHSLEHFASYKGSDNTTANIASTIVTTMQRYDLIAALWNKAETVYGNKPISLEHFLESSAILILGRSATAREAVENVNRLMLTRLIQLILEGPKRNYPAIHFYVDELSSLGSMPILKVALTELRKHGGSFIGVIQSFSQLLEVYGQNDANTMVSQFGTKIILRLADGTTSKWITELAGKVRLLRNIESTTQNHKSGDSITLGQQYEEQDVIRPACLQRSHNLILSMMWECKGYISRGINVGGINILHRLFDSYHLREILNAIACLCLVSIKP